MKYYLKLPVFHVKKNCKHLELYKLIKIGNKTVFKNNNRTLYDYSWINQCNQSFIIKSLKPNIYKEYI